ncbi:hypothetical protein BG003_010053 [Podila horticola]|nr:hypothetical protein BG003_010053 [Podila horticola]
MSLFKLTLVLAAATLAVLALPQMIPPGAPGAIGPNAAGMITSPFNTVMTQSNVITNTDIAPEVSLGPTQPIPFSQPYSYPVPVASYYPVPVPTAAPFPVKGSLWKRGGFGDFGFGFGGPGFGGPGFGGAGFGGAGFGGAGFGIEGPGFGFGFNDPFLDPTLVVNVFDDDRHRHRDDWDDNCDDDGIFF